MYLHTYFEHSPSKGSGLTLNIIVFDISEIALPSSPQELRAELCKVLADLSKRSDDGLLEEAVGLVRMALDDFKACIS
jgi:hypothetical protein